MRHNFAKQVSARLFQHLSKLCLQTDLLQSFLRHYEAGSTRLTRLYPGVTEALLALQQAGHPMAICTNKPLAATLPVLQAFDLTRFFPVVIGGDSLSTRKPHPAPLLAAWAQVVAPAAVFVGDSEVDAETAFAANLPFLLFTEGYRKTDIALLPHANAFSHHVDLPGLVADLQRKVLCTTALVKNSLPLRTLLNCSTKN